MKSGRAKFEFKKKFGPWTSKESSVPKEVQKHRGLRFSQSSFPFLTGWLRNRTGTGNRNRQNRFSRNRKRNRNRRNRFPGTETGAGTALSFLLNCAETRKIAFCRGTVGTETGTARTVPPPNCNRTEPNRGLPVLSSKQKFEKSLEMKTWAPRTSKKVRVMELGLENA